MKFGNGPAERRARGILGRRRRPIFESTAYLGLKSERTKVDSDVCRGKIAPNVLPVTLESLRRNLALCGPTAPAPCRSEIWGIAEARGRVSLYGRIPDPLSLGTEAVL